MSDKTQRRIGLLIFAAIVLAFIADARGDTAIYGGAWSKHFNASRDYNEKHNLFAVEYKSYMAGGFKNSYFDDTAFAAKRLSYKVRYLDLDFGLALGAMWGYRDCFSHAPEESKQWCPLIAPMVSYTDKPLQPTLILLGGLPNEDGEIEGAVALSIRLQLD